MVKIPAAAGMTNQWKIPTQYRGDFANTVTQKNAKTRRTKKLRHSRTVFVIPAKAGISYAVGIHTLPSENGMRKEKWTVAEWKTFLREMENIFAKVSARKKTVADSFRIGGGFDDCKRMTFAD